MDITGLHRSPESSTPEITPAITPNDEQCGLEITCRDVSFSPRKWMALFCSGQHKVLCLEFLRCLNYFRDNVFYDINAEERAALNSFVEQFLFYFCHRDLDVPEELFEAFIVNQPVITNIVAISDYETTTPWVSGLILRKENFFKLLALYNPRTNIEIEFDALFGISEFFASQWWSFFWLSVTSYCTKATYETIGRHLSLIENQNLVLFGSPARVSFFPATYVAPEYDSIAKRRLNTLAAKAFSNVKIQNLPNKKKIAIVTSKWSYTAVYTSVSPLIKSLKDHYDLTLVHLGPPRDDLLDKDMFERQLRVQMVRDQMDLTCLDNNDFIAAIYPDVGMSTESIYLINIRIAPIQITMYGHPTSTRGAKIDYFIGGQKVEDLTKVQDHYSERLVVLPGMGVHPLYPPVERPVDSQPVNNEPILINCAWTVQKITYPLLETLLEIKNRATRPFKFQFFSGGVLIFHNGMIPFAKDIWSVLGKEHVQLMPGLKKGRFYTEMLKGAFSMDSFPFGGFNTVIDSLYLKKPIIALKGDLAFGRFGAGTLETIGLEELIAHTKEEYIELTLRLIHDDEYRKTVSRKVGAIDLKAEIEQSQDPDYFRKAIDYVIENHDRLKDEPSRTPIVIGP